MAKKKSTAEKNADNRAKFNKKAGAANVANIKSVDEAYRRITGKAMAGERSSNPIVRHAVGGSQVDPETAYEDRPRVATIRPRKKGGFEYLFPNEAEPLKTDAGGLPSVDGRLASYDDYKAFADEDGTIAGSSTFGRPTGDGGQRDKGEQFLEDKYSPKDAAIKLGDIELLNPVERAQRAAVDQRRRIDEGEDPTLATLGVLGEQLGRMTIGDFAFEQGEGHDEAPQNAGQAIMNFLSTGTYAGARAAEGVGAAAAKYQRGESTPLEASGEAFVNTLGGAARGVGEGLGMRFDGQRPRTHGQNLEALGTADFLREHLGEDAGNFAQGAIGTVADIGLDPATYATLGASGAVRGAASGARAGAQQADTVPGAIAKGILGGTKGAWVGAAGRREELRGLRDAARSRRQAVREARGLGGTAAYNERNLIHDGELVDELVPSQGALEAPVLDGEASFAPERLALEAPRTVDEAIIRLEDEAAEAVPLREPAPLDTPAVKPDEAARMAQGAFDEDLLSPQARSATGRAVWNAMEEVGKVIKAKDPVVAEDFYRTAHNSILRSLSQTAGRATGAARAGIIRTRYRDAIRAVEAHTRAGGVIPHFKGDGHVGPLHVGVSDMLDAMDGNVVDLAFFSPNRFRASRGAEERAGFKGGFTLFPDQVGAGIQLARRGGTVDEVAALIAARHTAIYAAAKKANPKIGPNFANGAAGKAAIRAVAENITRDDFLAKMDAVDAHYRPMAELITRRQIDGVMDNAFATIAKAITEEADRGTLLATIDRAMDDMQAIVGDSPTLSAEGVGRLNQAILNGVLGETGFKAYKRTVENAAATGRRAPAAQKKAQDDHLAALRGEDVAEPKLTKPQSEQRQDAAAAGAKAVHEEADEILADIVDELGGRAYMDGIDELVTVEYLARLDNGYGNRFGSTMDRVLAGLSGARGLSGEALQARVGSENAAFTPMAAFSEKKMMTVAHIRNQLAARGGRKPSLEETHDYIRNRLWTALAHTDADIWTDAWAMRAALARGQEFPDTSKPGGALAFDALDEGEIEMAMAVRAMIDHVMNPEAGGMLGRSGLTVEDINDKLGARATDEQRDFLLKGEDIHSQAVAWRTWQALPDPLDMLDRMHQSIKLAEVPADLGRQFSGLFGSKYDPSVANWSREKFRENGYRRIDPDNAPHDSVMRFMDKDQWYSETELSQVRYLDMYLRAAKAPNPTTGFGKFVLAMDAPLHALKSLATIWRPAHHVTNVMGEMAMNAIVGVSPLQYIRSYRGLAAAQGLLDDPTNALTQALGELGVGRGLKIDPKFTKDTVRVHIKDSSGSRFEEIPLQELMKEWKSTGVALTHSAARDLIEDTVVRSGKRARILGRAIDTLERPVGDFSAVRDNLTRVGHAIHAMEKRTYSSLADAKAKTAAEVHDYHPTIRTLGAEEQRTARRLFMFYTWMRQAASRIIRTAADRPGLVTWPAKLQYNMAEAAGLNPESIGGPTTDDPRVSQYAGNSLIGPTLKGRPIAIDMLMKAMGWMPDEQAPGLAGQDEPADLWEYSLSTPQLDTLQTLFGGVNFDPERGVAGYLGGARGFSEDTIGESLNPLIVAGANTLGLGQQALQGDPTEQQTENLLQSGGALTAIAKMLGDPAGMEANAFDAAVKGISGTGRTEPMDAEESEQALEDRSKQIFNFFTGAKTQNRTRPKDAAGAKADWRERIKQELRNAGVTEPDVVDDIIDRAWEQEQRRIRG